MDISQQRKVIPETSGINQVNPKITPTGSTGAEPRGP